jgi:NADPH:quinone reductase and related Zn-dependent oxidoreductases
MRAAEDETIVPAATAARLPAGLDPVAAASLPLNGTLAANLVELLGPAEGRSLLVTGAAGSVDGYAVPLAVRAGWKVTDLAREADRDVVLRAGPTSSSPSCPGRSSTQSSTRSRCALRPGRGVRGGIFAAPPAPVIAEPERGIDVRNRSVQPHGAVLARAADGVLELRVAGAVPLTEAATAFARVAEPGQRGRWLLLP